MKKAYIVPLDVLTFFLAVSCSFAVLIVFFTDLIPDEHEVEFILWNLIFAVLSWVSFFLIVIKKRQKKRILDLIDSL